MNVKKTVAKKTPAKKTVARKTRATKTPAKKITDPANKKLTLREQSFVDEYVIDFNASRSAKAAGYQSKYHAERGYTLLRNVHIKNAIEKAVTSFKMSRQAARERVIEEVCRIAFFDMKNLYNPDGTLKNIHTMESYLTSAIVSVDITEQGGEGITKRVRVSDKLKALEFLCKLMGVSFVDKDDLPAMRVVLEDKRG